MTTRRAIIAMRTSPPMKTFPPSLNQTLPPTEESTYTIQYCHIPMLTETSYLQMPRISESTVSSDFKTVSTLSTQYTLYADTLEELITTQAQYPPVLTLRVQGTHSEKKKNNKTRVTDFDFKLDMTHLLIPSDGSKPGEMHMIPEGTKAYRGTRMPTESRAVDIEAGNELETWCTRYCDDPSTVKSFTLKRNVVDLDQARLRELVQSLIRSTNYLGDIDISYPLTAKNIVVYSPCKVNELRTLWYVRWFFYLTFLWIFAWPYLFFVTKRYEVVTADFPFSTSTCSDPSSKQYTSISEDDFFVIWRAAVKRAALAKMQGCIDEQYRLESVRLEGGQQARVPITGNAIADGALGFLEQTLVVGRHINNMRGWGANLC